MEQSVIAEEKRPRERNLWRSVCRFCHRSYSPVGGFEFLHAFRLKFWPFGLAQGVPGAVWFSLAALRMEGHLRTGFLILAGVKVVVAGFGASALVNRYFPIHLSEWGLRGRDLWGMAHEIAWEDIRQVKRIRWMIFTCFVRIHTHKRRDLVWLPLFLTDMPAFEGAVRELAPEGNPLRRYFEDNPA